MITLEEKPVIVELDEEHQDEYERFESSLQEKGSTLQWEIGQSAWSHYVPALQNYIDQPSFPQKIENSKKDGEILATDENTLFDKEYNNQKEKKKIIKHKKEGELLPTDKKTPFETEYETQKEKKLVELVQERLEENRGIVIYTSYTSKYKTNQHLQKLLQRYGINPVILNDK